jgi:hypothetical protein
VSVAGSTGSTGDYSSQNETQAQPWQQKVARTAMVGLTAAALGLALFQGRAKAAGAAAGSVAPALMTQVRQAAAAVASAAAVTPAMLGQHSTTKEVVHYRIMQLFAAPIYGKVLAVFAVAAPILLLGSVLYHKAAKDTTWSEAFMKPYAVLFNCPGTM